MPIERWYHASRASDISSEACVWKISMHQACSPSDHSRDRMALYGSASSQ